MRAEPVRPIGRMALAIGTSLLFAAGPAAGDPLTGQAQIQFQKIDQRAQILQPDGTRRDTTFRREIWVQNYELNHAARIGRLLSIYSQLRLSELSNVGRVDASRTPYGALRVVHPVFGLTGSYRPASVTTATAGGAFLEGDPAATPLGQLTTRNQEALFSGYLAAPRLPRVDLSWTRRHRDPNPLAAEETGISRDARLAYEAGVLNLRASYNDLRRDQGVLVPRQIVLRNLNGGAGLHLSPVPALTLGMQYDVSASRRGAAGPNTERALTHAAILNGGLRQSEHARWDLAYAYRRSEFRNGTRTELDDHDGSLVFNLSPGRGTRLSAAGGARTVQILPRSRIQRYVALVASADGAVLPGWTGTASTSHATNWDPERGTYSVENLRVGSRWRLTHRLDADADAQVIANGDTAARDSRATTQWSLGLQAVPLLGLTVRIAVRSYRVGPGVFSAVGDVRSSTVDVRWRPFSSLEASGSITSGGGLSRTDPQLSTRQASLNWRPGPRLQLSGGYTRSDQTSTAQTTTQLTGREFLSGRLLAAVGRRTTLSAGISEANSNGQRGSRQIDVAVTRGFGR